MDRPHLVYVGGTEGQVCECLYIGTDGEKAQDIFDAAGNDGSNAVVRYCRFFEHTQIRTPKRDGVPPKAKPVGNKANPKTPPAPAGGAPAESQPETNGDDTQSDDETGI